MMPRGVKTRSSYYPMKKILLLNLPFERPVQRDYGCPHDVKADYYWPPMDLLLFGAMVRDAGDISYLDCLAGKLIWNDVLPALQKIDPTIIFTTVSSLTLRSDLEYLKKLKQAVPLAQIWGSGDVIFFSEEQYAVVDVYVRDLTNRTGILELLSSSTQKGVVGIGVQVPFSYGISPHELVKKYNYAMPYSLYPAITAVLTNYGCPFHCTFCNSNALPFKKRSIDEIIQELLYIQQVGIREVLFRDFTFNLSDVDQLCDKIKRHGIHLAWSCWTRADLVNEAVLRAMKEAGCYLISYGIESGDDDILARSRKHLDTRVIHEAVRLSRAAGIEVLASVILGFPGEDPERTQRYVRELDPDYLAVNLLSIRTGSMDSRENPSLVTTGCDPLAALGPDQTRLRDRVEKDFYLRPRKLFRYVLLSLKSQHRFFIFLKNALALWKKWNS